MPLTGVEIAGLVLAILPLIITIVQEREVGIRPIDALIFTSSGKKKVSGILSDEQLRFRRCCERLLCEVGIENVGDYTDAGEDARNHWAHPKLKKKFLERLGDSYENFERKMQEINERSTRIYEYIKANRFLFSLKSLANNKDVLRLHECISTLREFVIDLPFRAHNQSTLPVEMDLLNSQCIELHRHVRQCWSCKCREKHVLYIMMRQDADEDELKLLFAADEKVLDPDPEISSWTWQPAVLVSTMVESRSRESLNGVLKTTKSATTGLCDTLSLVATSRDDRDVHLLSFEGKVASQILSGRRQPRDASMTTLADELAKDSGEIRMYGSGYLGVRDCLDLAILLLVAVLKYRLTPWLLNEWSSQNIYLVQRARSLSRSDLRKPFLKSGFPCSTAQIEEYSFKDSSQVSSGILFEVGVMLLEIVHGNSFDRLMTEKERAGAAESDPEDRLMWRERAARRLYTAFPDYMCLRSYKEVTERCLKNQFSDGMERDLFQRSFRTAIYSKAVKPLLEDAARVR